MLASGTLLLPGRAGFYAQRVAFGLAAIAAASGLRLLAEPLFGYGSPYVLYLLPVIAASVYGGMGSGIATALFGAVLVAFGGPRIHALRQADLSYLALFLIDSIWIGWIGEQMRNSLSAARESRARLQSAMEKQSCILQSISDAFGALDAEFRFVYANEKMAAMAGCPAEELAGKPVWQALPEFADIDGGEIRRATEEREPVRLERFVPRLGRWYETSAYPSSGGVSLVARDISDRRRNEQMLRESEQRLRLAPEAARVGTWTYDLDTEEVVWSPEVERILGLEPGVLEPRAEALFARIHPDDRDAVRNVFSRAVRRTGEYEIEFRFLHASGETRWMLSRGRVFPDEASRRLQLIGVGIEVTGQKQQEERMRHAQKLESLGVLAGGVAHKFNNLLTGILGNAGLATEYFPPEHNVRRLLEAVIHSGQEAAHLTQQMLSYSGKGSFVVESVRLSDVISSISLLAGSSIPKNVDLRLELDRFLPAVEADPGQIQHLVINLVTNAAEAIPADSGGTITVRTRLERLGAPANGHNGGHSELPAGEFAVLEVEDTGTGMDETTQARIFEPFYTTKFAGRGLGLPAALGIVRAHKGAMQVSSSQGRGSLFRILLPVQARRAPHNGVPHAPDGRGTVLVVSEDPVIRNLATAILERGSYRVQAADNPDGALEILDRPETGVALVVLDVPRPEPRTRYVVQRIRAVSPCVPLMIASGYDESDVLAGLGGLAVEGFLTKPYTPAEMLAKVESALCEHSVAR